MRGARTDVAEGGGPAAQSRDWTAWYDEVVREARLAGPAAVPGCATIGPYGYRIWELIREDLDRRLGAAGRRNARFPLLVPRAALDPEAGAGEGPISGTPIVTRADGETLEEPVALRPGSGAAVWPALAEWIRSRDDLPLRLNQWTSAVRWEPASRPFLRETEMPAQRGHSAHATEEEAEREALRMVSVYRELARERLALPVVAGERPPAARGPGPLRTWACEAMMKDGRAIRIGTAHGFGQAPARAYGIRFPIADDAIEHAWSASCGTSARLVAALILGHGDDDGLVLPPRVAPHQVVILPAWESDERRTLLLEVARRIGGVLGRHVRVHVDDRDEPGPEAKRREWERRGVPLRMEIGPEEVGRQRVALVQRVPEEGERPSRTVKEMVALELVPRLLDGVQRRLLDAARARHEALSARGIGDLDALAERVGGRGGFAWTGWCGGPACAEEGRARTGATIRLIPDAEGRSDPAPERCVACGAEAETEVVWARAH